MRRVQKVARHKTSVFEPGRHNVLVAEHDRDCRSPVEGIGVAPHRPRVEGGYLVPGLLALHQHDHRRLSPHSRRRIGCSLQDRLELLALHGPICITPHRAPSFQAFDDRVSRHKGPPFILRGASRSTRSYPVVQLSSFRDSNIMSPLCQLNSQLRESGQLRTRKKRSIV